jgi:hypothetical protein
MRMALGIVAGIIVMVLCVGGVEYVGQMLDPLPAGLDIWNREAMSRHMESMPLRAFAFVALAWFVGALAGAATADKIARRAVAGWVVAILVVIGAVLNLVTYPHPAWMWVAGIALPLIAAVLARRLTGTPA